MSCKLEIKNESHSESNRTETLVRELSECNHCGAKLLVSHMPDYGNLLIEETKRCLDCGSIHQKVFHTLN